MGDLVQVHCFLRCICICVPSCLHLQLFILPFISMVLAQLSEEHHKQPIVTGVVCAFCRLFHVGIGARKCNLCGRRVISSAQDLNFTQNLLMLCPIAVLACVSTKFHCVDHIFLCLFCCLLLWHNFYSYRFWTVGTNKGTWDLRKPLGRPKHYVVITRSPRQMCWLKCSQSKRPERSAVLLLCISKLPRPHPLPQHQHLREQNYATLFLHQSNGPFAKM